VGRLWGGLLAASRLPEGSADIRWSGGALPIQERAFAPGMVLRGAQGATSRTHEVQALELIDRGERGPRGLRIKVSLIADD
jgi:hypothetical protein